MNKTVDFGLLNSQTDERYGSRKYGKLGTIAKNGCGMIALYNIERAADETVRFEPFYEARKQIKTNFFGLLGTRTSSIARNLRKKGFEVRSFRPKKATDAELYDGVIVLAWFFYGAHYISGIGNGDGTYTFYNQYYKPCTMTLTAFLEDQARFKQHPYRVWGIQFPKREEETKKQAT